MTQSIEYVVKVNATQAQAAIADVEKRFGGVNSVVARVDKSIIALERDIKDLNAAIARGGPNVDHYRRELERLTGAMSGGGGALGGAMAAVGGRRNLGQAALEASRAFEDLQYGIGGVVNNIPSLVMAFGGGAGLTAAISLAAVGVNQLVKNFISVPNAAETATTTARQYVSDLRDEIADLGKELRLVQIGATGVAMEEQRKRIQIAMVEAKGIIDSVGGPERLARLRELTGDDPSKLGGQGVIGFFDSMGPLARRNIVSPELFRAAIDAQTKLDLEIKKMQQLQLIELEKADKEAAKDRGEKSGRAYIEGLITAMSDPRSEATAGMFSTAGLRGTVAGNIAEAEMEAEITAAAERKALAMRSLETDLMIQKMRTEIADAEAKKREQIAKREGEAVSRTVVATANIVAEGFVGLASGQEDAIENMIASLSRQAGGFITLEGGKTLAAGIAGASMGNPMAPGQIAVGLGLVAAGAAVSVGGPAAVSAIMGASSGGGPTGATRDPGASPRSSGTSSGTGGPLIVNVSYGAGGPLPEDVAREIHRTVRSGDRRSGR